MDAIAVSRWRGGGGLAVKGGLSQVTYSLVRCSVVAIVCCVVAFVDVGVRVVLLSSNAVNNGRLPRVRPVSTVALIHTANDMLRRKHDHLTHSVGSKLIPGDLVVLVVQIRLHGLQKASRDERRKVIFRDSHSDDA